MEIKDLRQEYESVEMSKEQLEKMKNRINEAKAENAQEKIVPINRSRKMYSRILGAVAALAIIFVALPNMSANVAKAMGDMPVIGGLVSLVTFRDYTYEDDKKSATIDRTYLSSQNEMSEDAVAAINEDIKKYTDSIIEEFKKDLEKDGYENVTVSSQVITTSDKYFTLKLSATITAADSATESRYYTIDLKTGKQVLLKDLFAEGDDYVTPISENIKEQMKKEMADKNDQSLYFLEDEDFDGNFSAIKADQNFYINENQELVICFDQGEVGPMSTGSPSFVIPTSIFN